MPQTFVDSKSTSSRNKLPRNPTAMESLAAEEEDLVPRTATSNEKSTTSIGWHQKFMPRRERLPSLPNHTTSASDDSSLDGNDTEEDEVNRNEDDNDNEEDPFTALQRLLEKRQKPSGDERDKVKRSNISPDDATTARREHVDHRFRRMDDASLQNPSSSSSRRDHIHRPAHNSWNQHGAAAAHARSEHTTSVLKVSQSRKAHWSERQMGGNDRMLPASKKPKIVVNYSAADTTLQAFARCSIVGSRPDHWVAKTPSSTKTVDSSNCHKKEAATRIISKLAEATKKRRFLLLDPSNSRSPAKRGVVTLQTRERLDNEVENATSNVLDGFSPDENDFDGATQMGDLLTPRPPGYGNHQLAMAESITGGNSSGSPACAIPEGSPKRSRRSTKRLKTHGPLMNRLMSLQREDDADCVRLRSSSSSTSSHMTNLNDPRKNAKSIMNVTIMEEPTVWEVEKELVSVLAYVHSHVVLKDTGVADDALVPPYFVTMFFTFETARQQRLRGGLHLRLYNVVLIPNVANLSLVTEYQDGDQHQNAPLPVAAVVCTRLCEPYPAGLPALRCPLGLTDNVGGTALVESNAIYKWGRNERVVCDEHII